MEASVSVLGIAAFAARVDLTAAFKRPRAAAWL
jgi:hypothetical protein